MSESGAKSSLATDAIMHDAIDGPLAALPNVDGSIKRDSEVWFEDGNIIVIAQTTAFRFHKSVVSIHCSVFRDLFSIPRPSLPGEEVDETFDGGCPVVRVSDTSYDFRELIRAIYSGVSYLHPEQVVTFPVLAALARLSHKYQLDQLLAAVIHRMKGTFTTQLDVWEQSGRFCWISALRLDSTYTIEALNLFRLLDRPEMIPVALYECCQHGPAFLLQGTTRKDGVTQESLSPSDLELCFQVRGELVRATVHLLTELCESYTARLLQASSSPSCSSPAMCLGSLKTLLEKCHENLRDCIFPDPLDSYYIAMLDNVVYNEELCGACADVFQAECSQLRKKIWASLPRLMKVEVAEWDSA
ncbi:hypothetical protein V8D89_001819 [Ganoderma adspersum]